PNEVYTEFKATPTEDVKRVDMALFADNLSEDAIFIECKGTSNLTKGLPEDLAKVERQLRDYNKDNTAQLAIITNGRTWRFYYCYTSGEFASKHFKTLNISEDDLVTVADYFTLFLSKAAVSDRSARTAAESFLNLTRKQQRMQDARPEAERRITQYPFPSLPDALMQVVAEQHTSVTRQEAEAFLEGHEHQLSVPRPTPAASPTPAPLPAAKPAKPRQPVASSKPKPSHRPTPAPSQPSPQLLAGERFTLTQGILQATAYLQSDGKLLVQAGSRAAAVAAPSLSARRLPLRRELSVAKVLIVENDYLVFTTDYLFPSANIAAEIIVARSVNAQIIWKHISGKQVRDFLG
ncbi:MAG: DUF4357 domain-containing protein, partial [Hymenobacter sp.]